MSGDNGQTETDDVNGLQVLAGIAIALGLVVAALTAGTWVLGFFWRVFKAGAGID